MAQTVASQKREITPEEIAGNVKRTAKNIRDAAIRTRLVVKALVETGAIEEVSEAVRETVVTYRYMAAQARETAKEIERKGIAKDVRSAVAETRESAKDTIQVIKGGVAATTA